MSSINDRTVNGTFAGFASFRRRPTAMLRPSGGRGSSPLSLKETKERS